MAAKKNEPKVEVPANVPVLGPEAVTPAVNVEAELPELVSTTYYKKGKTYYVLAIKSQGRRILDQAVVSTSDFRMEAQSELAELNEAIHVGNHNPFKKEL